MPIKFNVKKKKSAHTKATIVKMMAEAERMNDVGRLYWGSKKKK